MSVAPFPLLVEKQANFLSSALIQSAFWEGARAIGAPPHAEERFLNCRPKPAARFREDAGRRLKTVPLALTLANNGTITAPLAALAVMLSISMVGSLAKLEVFSENMRQVEFTVKGLQEFLEMPELPAPKTRAAIASTGVELKNVRFSYTGQEKDEVLHGVSLRLPQGSFTALVGPSGGGKSTVAKLIARFWDVSSGSVEIDGVNVKDMPLSQLSEYVSFVTQDNFLFRCSLLENIRLTHYDIAFRHVDFGYDSRQVLKDVSFAIPEKTSTAIVGPSGSGKTTICSLLARFYDPQRGSVEIGGHNLKELTCDSLLSNISMVFQNVYLFNDTIRANICFGKPDATEEEMIAAAKKARCRDFIMALPQGYDTVVGEGGGTLSGGEKQRVSIARAMLKDAPIIILDEATASIDPENEHLIQSALSELTRGKTIITIAHRLATHHSECRSDPGGGRRPHRRARNACGIDAARRRVPALHRDPREGRGLAHRRMRR